MIIVSPKQYENYIKLCTAPKCRSCGGLCMTLEEREGDPCNECMRAHEALKQYSDDLVYARLQSLRRRKHPHHKVISEYLDALDGISWTDETVLADLEARYKIASAQKGEWESLLSEAYHAVCMRDFHRGYPRGLWEERHRDGKCGDGCPICERP